MIPQSIKNMPIVTKIAQHRNPKTGTTNAEHVQKQISNNLHVVKNSLCTIIINYGT